MASRSRWSSFPNRGNTRHSEEARMNRPIDHVAIAVRDLQRAEHFFIE
jgi:hypothetical protein